MVRKCNKCEQIKELDLFNFKVKSLNVRHYHCRECTRAWIRNHYKRNRDYYLEKTRKRNKQLNIAGQSFVLDYLSKHACIDCGEKDVRVLEFDHVDREVKLKEISSLMHRYSVEVLRREINKCEVRCANCHRRKTAQEFGWFKNKNYDIAKSL